MTNEDTQLAQTKHLRKNSVAIGVVIDGQTYYVHFFVCLSDSEMFLMTIEISSQKDLITGHKYRVKKIGTLTELVDEYARQFYHKESIPDNEAIAHFQCRKINWGGGYSVSVSNALILSYCRGVLENTELSKNYFWMVNAIKSCLGENMGKWVNEDREITYNFVHR